MIRYLICLFAACLLPACGADDAKLQTRAGYRCEQDGLCFTSQASDLFAGAYRKGDLEIEFDVAYRPAFINTIKHGSSYCDRLLLESQHRWLFNDNSNCPRAWHEMSSNAFTTERYDAFPLYEKLVHEMKAAVDAHPIPHGLSDHWSELNDMLKIATDRRAPNFSDDVEHISSSEPSDAGRLVVYGENDAVNIEPGDTLDGQTSQGLSFSSSSGGGDKITPSYREAAPGREFRQEIELWSQKTLMFLFFGPETHDDHTGTRSHVYFRRIGSDEPWSPYDTVTAGNHGSRPGQDRMKHYTTCRDLPVTRDFFAAGGECEGGWAIEHLCNDDAAYQIWHANGNWNGGHHCLGKRRTNRPWCGNPW